MGSLSIPDQSRLSLKATLKDRLKSQLLVLNPATQADAILAHHQSQTDFLRTGRELDRTIERINAFHRAAYHRSPTPVQLAIALRADQLSADGSPDAIVVEIEKLRERLCEDQAAHFVDQTMTDLASLGAIGAIEELANGGLRLRFIKNGSTITLDAVMDGARRSAHTVAFTSQSE